MELLTKQGQSKLVESCTYPLTDLACVSRVYTDFGVIATGSEGAKVVELIVDLTLDDLREKTGLPLEMASQTFGLVG